MTSPILRSLLDNAIAAAAATEGFSKLLGSVNHSRPYHKPGRWIEQYEKKRMYCDQATKVKTANLSNHPLCLVNHHT